MHSWQFSKSLFYAAFTVCRLLFTDPKIQVDKRVPLNPHFALQLLAWLWYFPCSHTGYRMSADKRAKNIKVNLGLSGCANPIISATSNRLPIHLRAHPKIRANNSTILCHSISFHQSERRRWCTFASHSTSKQPFEKRVQESTKA